MGKIILNHEPWTVNRESRLSHLPSSIRLQTSNGSITSGLAFQPVKRKVIKYMIAVKKRDSNIELLRNISMFLILVIHANFVALPHISYEEFVSNTTPSVVRFFIEAIGIVAVNIFVFISGWFGINTRKKSVLSFIYMVIFWLGGGILSQLYSVKHRLV